MSDEADNLVLVILRRIDAKMDRLAADVTNLKVRMSALEAESGYVRVGLAELNSRLDRMDARLERIERRLDLTDVPAWMS